MKLKLKVLRLLACHAARSSGSPAVQGDHHTPSPYVTQAFHKYLQCGIFAHGFARARCDDCGHDFFVAFSCKGRGVCPSCNSHRMAETAAHLVDHVFPHLPVRQRVLSVPKRLRYFMQRDNAVSTPPYASSCACCNVICAPLPRGAAQISQAQARARIGAVDFIHRFGSSLNAHVQFHVCMVDKIFAMVPNKDAAEPSATEQAINFHAAQGLDASAIAQVQQEARQRILRAFVAHGLIDANDYDIDQRTSW